MGSGGRRLVARREDLDGTLRHVALLAPENGRPAAGPACQRGGDHDGAFRPGAGRLCLTTRKRGWIESGRTYEREPEIAALDVRAARRAVRDHTGSVERRRTDGQGLLHALCNRPQSADVGCGDDVHSATAAEICDARTACRIPRRPPLATRGPSWNHGDDDRERTALLRRNETRAARSGRTACQRPAA